MTEAHDPIALDLESLPLQTELSREVAEYIAMAASVVLDRKQRQRLHDPVDLLKEGDVLTALLRRCPIADKNRNSFADPLEATAKGGEGVAVLVAHRILDRIVFRRLPIATGADYAMRDPNIIGGDTYERLECSGIADGRQSPASRLREKIDQLATRPDLPNGWAVVTCFRSDPVEVHFGAWPKNE